MDLRKDDTLFVINYSKIKLKFKKQDALDLTKAQQLPTNKYVIERYYTILGGIPTNTKGRENSAINELVVELRYLWIYMNLPPKSRQSVTRALKKIIQTVSQLKNGHASRKAWQDQFNNLNGILEDGFDIYDEGVTALEVMKEEYGLEPGEEEEKLYIDNCKRLDRNGNKTAKCPRSMWNAGVDKKWLSAAKARQRLLEKREEFKKQKRERIAKEQLALKELHESTAKATTSIELCVSSCSSNAAKDNEGDDNFQPSAREMPSKVIKQNLSEADKHSTFPEICVRTGYKTFNQDVIECLVVMEAVYKVDANKCPSLLAFIANKVFGQHWSPISPEVEDDEAMEKTDDTTHGKKKKRKKLGVLNHVLPSRRAIRHYVEDFSILSFKDMAESYNCS